MLNGAFVLARRRCGHPIKMIQGIKFAELHPQRHTNISLLELSGLMPSHESGLADTSITHQNHFEFRNSLRLQKYVVRPRQNFSAVNGGVARETCQINRMNFKMRLRLK